MGDVRDSGNCIAADMHGNIQCDHCRARKVCSSYPRHKDIEFSSQTATQIRCDKGPGAAPCSGCRTAQRECKSTHVGSKTKEVKHRVLISHQ